MSSTCLRPALLGAAIIVAGCGSSGGDGGSGSTAGTQVAFNIDPTPGEPTDPSAFYDMPWPSDLRLDADGNPDLTGFPNPQQNATMQGLIDVAAARKGFPTVAVGWFRFDGPLGDRAVTDAIAADAASPVLLVDVDDSSPDRGKLYPTVAVTPPEDDKYVPAGLLDVAAYPGTVLRGGTRYAFVIRRSLGDADGKKLGVPAALRTLEAGKALPGPKGQAARDLYAPLWQTLKDLNVPLDDVAAATVFTTGDVVADTARMADALLDKYDPTVNDLQLVPASVGSTRFCELKGTVDMPQFQKGTPQFDEDGEFVLDASGVPTEQRTETIPVVVTLPKSEMPAAGYPLVLYVHGSGGISTQVADRGTITTVGGTETPGEGPSYVLAEHGFAAASSAMPLNPERYPGAGDLAYINFNNLAAMPYTFRQGVFEQRLLIKALAKLSIDPATLGACTGPTLPAGASTFKLDLDPLMLQGQSMGGMYTNMIGAVEPAVKAVAPSGAGGFWSQFIIHTHYVGNLGKLFGVLAGVGVKVDLDFTYPALHILEVGWEPADPMVYGARLARRPLPGAPARPIYEPVAPDDEYFPVEVYNAMVLANGNKQAGDIQWQSMQDTLKLDGRDGIVAYPVSNELSSESGDKYTGVVVQYKGDGIADPHYIFAQLDDVKYQYGCFFKSFLDTGTATVPAPAPLGTPCPE